MAQVIRATLLILAVAGFYTFYTILQVHEVPSTSWLLNNPNIADEAISDNVMPDYFNLSAPLIPQYERYFNETKLIMKNRVDNIKHQCTLNKNKIKELSRMFYFAELNMAWCPVFKAGSTNWKQFFCKIYKPHVYYQYLKATEEPYCPIDKLKSYRSKYHLRNKIWMADMQGSLRFLTVRHPYERLVSAYNNKFKNCDSTMFSARRDRMVQILMGYRKVSVPASRKAPLLEAARKECLKPAKKRRIDKDNPYMNPMGVTFREFIEHIVDGKTDPDFHWMSATQLCDVCRQDYDIVEKFETLERDHYYILQTLGEETLYPDIAGAHGNPSGNHMGTAGDKIIEYFSDLNEELLWGLQNIYKDDFDKFGYKPYFRVKTNPIKS